MKSESSARAPKDVVEEGKAVRSEEHHAKSEVIALCVAFACALKVKGPPRRSQGLPGR
jgi:hypothetical protein